MIRDIREEPVTLHTEDSVLLSAAHLSARVDTDLAIVLAHGFSGTWRNLRTRFIMRAMSARAGVVAFDFRGHGGSGGVSTVGDREILDVAAAVAWARRHGYRRIALAGFSMGASVVVRYAALYDGVAAVAAVSGPAHWYYRGTTAMRWLHHVVEWPFGRLVGRLWLRTRISADGWSDIPLTPEQLAPKIAPTPLLVFHGGQDRFFPLRHAHALFDSAGEPRQLWIDPTMGHAESAMTPQRVQRLTDWLCEAAGGSTVPPGS
jgi:pimeloyl-ACP methyl ester carboxylesterase